MNNPVTDKTLHTSENAPVAEGKVGLPLSLEEAVAMAPPDTRQPFAASTAAIAWGAVRSGMSVWEYIIGMTREFEERLQAAYDAWKVENAWYRDKPDEQPQKGDVAEPIVSAAAESIPSAQAAEGEKKAAPNSAAELNHALATLPKDPDPSLYEAILASTDRETLKAALEALIEKRKRIHRPRTAQAAFLQWLEEAQNE